MNRDCVGFSKEIVCADNFVSMPLTTQAFYFHLSLTANDGVITCMRAMLRTFDSVTENDLKLLEENGYIVKEDDSYRIVHWKENMGIGEVSQQRNSYSYRKWRAAIIARDKVCQFCGSSDNLQAHHKKGFSLYPELRLSMDNGITLCDKCHKNLHKGERNGRS